MADPSNRMPNHQSSATGAAQHAGAQHAGAQHAGAQRTRKPYRSPKRRLVIGLIKFALVAYAVMLGTLVLMESRLVYPAAYFKADPSEAETIGSVPDVQPIRYDSTDGLTLTGRLVERPNATKTILFFHGNGARAAWLDPWAAALARSWDATVMIAEYRGYEDDAEPTEKGVIDDCIAARDFLCQRYNLVPNQIILYGRSLGGGCAVAVASQGGARALILERTFDRMVDLAARNYPFLPIQLLMKNRYDSIGRLVVYDGPLIQLHGTEDQTIPIDHGRRLFESAPSTQKHWIEVPGLGHNGSLPASAMREIIRLLEEFDDSSSIDRTEDRRKSDLFRPRESR